MHFAGEIIIIGDRVEAERGDRGDDGWPGLQGPDGFRGETGFAGFSGEDGEKGEAGLDGLQVSTFLFNTDGKFHKGVQCRRAEVSEMFFI